MKLKFRNFSNKDKEYVLITKVKPSQLRTNTNQVKRDVRTTSFLSYGLHCPYLECHLKQDLECQKVNKILGDTRFKSDSFN